MVAEGSEFNDIGLNDRIAEDSSKFIQVGRYLAGSPQSKNQTTHCDQGLPRSRFSLAATSRFMAANTLQLGHSRCSRWPIIRRMLSPKGLKIVKKGDHIVRYTEPGAREQPLVPIGR